MVELEEKVLTFSCRFLLNHIGWTKIKKHTYSKLFIYIFRHTRMTFLNTSTLWIPGNVRKYYKYNLVTGHRNCLNHWPLQWGYTVALFNEAGYLTHMVWVHLSLQREALLKDNALMQTEKSSAMVWDLRPNERFWAIAAVHSYCALHQYHPNIKWEPIFWKNGVLFYIVIYPLAGECITIHNITVLTACGGPIS